MKPQRGPGMRGMWLTSVLSGRSGRGADGRGEDDDTATTEASLCVHRRGGRTARV